MSHVFYDLLWIKWALQITQFCLFCKASQQYFFLIAVVFIPFCKDSICVLIAAVIVYWSRKLVCVCVCVGFLSPYTLDGSLLLSVVREEAALTVQQHQVAVLALLASYHAVWLKESTVDQNKDKNNHASFPKDKHPKQVKQRTYIYILTPMALWACLFTTQRKPAAESSRQ